MIAAKHSVPFASFVSKRFAVKQMPAYKFTPVIMLTTESEESKKREGQAAGARAWVVKPFQPEQLINAVQRLCLP